MRALLRTGTAVPLPLQPVGLVRPRTCGGVASTVRSLSPSAAGTAVASALLGPGWGRSGRAGWGAAASGCAFGADASVLAPGEDVDLTRTSFVAGAVPLSTSWVSHFQVVG